MCRLRNPPVARYGQDAIICVSFVVICFVILCFIHLHKPPPQFFDETLNCELGKQSTIQATDNCLAKIAQTHPSPSPRYVSHGKAMHSPKELATLSRPPLISPSQPCGMNNGKRFRAVFFVFSTSEDFNRRSTIRSTYGGALRKHPQAQLYFVLAKSKKSK